MKTLKSHPLLTVVLLTSLLLVLVLLYLSKYKPQEFIYMQF